nr:MAG TPA: hypothetical protein [Bacteriophage sp.]
MKFEKGTLVKINAVEEELLKLVFTANLTSLIHFDDGEFIDDLKNGMEGTVIFNANDEKDSSICIVDFGEEYAGYGVRETKNGGLDIDPTKQGHCMAIFENQLEEVVLEHSNEELIVACNYVRRGDKLVLSIITKNKTYESEIDYNEEAEKSLIEQHEAIMEAIKLVDSVAQSMK